MIIDVHPEFGYEMACSMPYAYWLHKRGELEKVVTCKGMKPFYYFCKNVEEKYEHRSVNNSINGVQNLPNPWIHHNADAVFGKDYGELSETEQTQVNGVLDYSQWEAPPIKEHFKDDKFKFGDKTIIIANKISMDHGQEPHSYFDIQVLYDMFNYLTEKNYTIIYKRPKMNEFTIDENEIKTLNNKYTISAFAEGLGLVDDYKLTEYYDNIILLDNIVKDNRRHTYNEIQLKTFANVDNFISIAGGNSIFCSYFGGKQVTYVTTSKELRPGYYDGDSYTKKLGGAKIYPVIDPESEIIKRGYNDYVPLMNKIKEVF
tara:strand:- start:1318 stop:2265 length:948 start_codon:yes stop_codon:yes gene_type:complete